MRYVAVHRARWGPQGLAVTVQQMDLRPGGTLYYTMTAMAPQMVAFMQANGMLTATAAQITCDEALPMKRCP